MKVDKLQTSKAGKHGAAKARLFASGLFDNIKKIIVKPGDSRMDVPIIEKRSCQVVAALVDSAQLMDLEDYSMSELRIPEELKGLLTEGDEVITWKFGNYSMIKSKK